MKRSIIMVFTIVFVFVAASAAALTFDTSFGGMDAGNTTINGVNGYIVIPSAEPAWDGKDTTVQTGYSAIFSGSFAHIPFVQVGFSKDFEVSVASDISNGVDILLGGKWRFDHSGSRSLALGLVGQALDVTNTLSLAAQLYFASTFNSTLIDWPAKTTLLIGYTIDGSPNTDIDFGMGFQTAFMKDVFNGKVDFVLDFGNVSYSSSPSGANASSRGLLNIGLRLLPIEFTDSVFVSADLRGLDILDDSGRALSAAVGISYNP